MNKIILILSTLSLINCSDLISQIDENTTQKTSVNNGKIKVLNFGTFHMGSTTDANSIPFDINDKKNQADAKAIAKLIAEFKPTIICVEVPREKNEELNKEYQKYLVNPSKVSTYSGEIGLVAFEVGRISKVARLEGIDYEMSYNYNIGSEIVNSIDSTTLKKFYANPFVSMPELSTVNPATLSLLEKLKINNSQKYLDFLITINADLLTHIGTEKGYEGADEAAKFYKRNLRIYSNLNRIHATKDDRIFILSGGSHAAFLKEFMERSPKYELVNTLNYLK
jgi:hypothetical protein